MTKLPLPLLLLLAAFALPVSAQQQSATISGTVTDGEAGLPLPNANVYVSETGTGSVTDLEGRYTVSGLEAGSYTVLFSFTGYQNQERVVELAAGQTLSLDVALAPGIELDPIQITAGRRQEKVLDAPASIDVIDARELQTEIVASTVKALRNVTGLDMAQTGLDRYEVVLRGFNNTFSGATYVLTDYRQAAVPSVGVNFHSSMPTTSVDIERIEIVRGPGSALYGAGVDNGVIHYITKDPFTHRGTTVSVTGGQRSVLGLEGRVAHVFGQKLGVKFVGQYGRGNDFSLESCAPELVQAGRFSECPDAVDAVQLAIDGIQRDTDISKAIMNATAEYRFSENTRLIATAGHSTTSSVLLSGLGAIRADGYTYTFGQLRFQSGGFFAQAYVNTNDAGKSQIYGGEKVVELSNTWSAQAQYNFQMARGREQVVIGADLELTRPNTDGTVFGRYEDEDNIDEYGAYLQSTTRIASGLELVGAARADYNTVIDDLRISPRLGIVAKPALGHSLRATYNHSYSSPSVTSLFLDIIGGVIPGTDIKLRGRGVSHGYTWERNPAYLAAGATTDLVASSLIPGQEGAAVPVGIGTGLLYGLIFDALGSTPPEDIAAQLTALGIPVTAPVVGLLLDLLNPEQTVVDGFSPGVMGILNLSEQTIDNFPTDLAPVSAIKPRTSQTYEIGYKGIFSEKVLVALDAYYGQTKNFVGSLQIKTPFVLVPTLAADLTRDIAAGIAGNAVLAGLLGGFGLTPEAVAAIIVQLANETGGLPNATTPIAIVETRENKQGEGNTPELMVTYPNFGTVSYYGLDLAIQYLASRKLSLFGNVSWVNDNFFSADEIGEDDPSLAISLNAPSLKTKLGGVYRHSSGLELTASGRFIQGFPVISGPYVGDVEDYFIMDLGMGYSFVGGLSGLRAGINVSNIFDSNHREFIGAPKLGRVAVARLTYAFGAAR